MGALKLGIAVEKLRLSRRFRISGFVFEEQEAVVVTLATDRIAAAARRRAFTIWATPPRRWWPRLRLRDAALKRRRSRGAAKIAASGRRTQCGGLRTVGTRCTAAARTGFGNSPGCRR